MREGARSRLSGWVVGSEGNRVGWKRDDNLALEIRHLHWVQRPVLLITHKPEKLQPLKEMCKRVNLCVLPKVNALRTVDYVVMAVVSSH